MSKEKINEIKEETAVIKAVSFRSIVEEYKRLEWEAENGDFTEAMQEALAANEENAERKLLGMYYVIQMNTSKIDNFYKLEIEDSQAKIKRLNKANGILKENCMTIAEMYGHKNKYTSLGLNCSKVTKEVLAIDEVPYEIRVAEIKDIINGMREDDSTVDEFNCFSTDFTIKNLDIADAIKVRKLIAEHMQGKEISFNPTLDKKQALELVKYYQPETIDATQKSVFNIKEASKEIGLKGVSLGYTYFPRFS